MKKRDAVAILIRHAAQNIQGSGCGFRIVVTQTEAASVVEAIEKLWSMAYRFPLDNNQRYAIGIPPKEAADEQADD